MNESPDPWRIPTECTVFFQQSRRVSFPRCRVYMRNRPATRWMRVPADYVEVTMHPPEAIRSMNPDGSEAVHAGLGARGMTMLIRHAGISRTWNAWGPATVTSRPRGMTRFTCTLNPNPVLTGFSLN